MTNQYNRPEQFYPTLEQEERWEGEAMAKADEYQNNKILDREVLIGDKIVTIEEAHQEVDQMTYLMSDIISFLDKTKFVTNGELHTMMNAHQYLRNTRNYISDQVVRQYPDMTDSFYTI